MYDYLFVNNAEYEAYFSGDFGEQVRMFTEITKLLGQIIENLDGFDAMKPELTKLARIHIMLKIPLEGFTEMWYALDLALTLIFETHYTARVRYYLRNVFKRVVTVFEEEYNKDG
eukprot:TRINITY_DN5637_c0_g1_i1.p1 TRINITY_DN5637_c0_g1~~TRINITY_DN5637_c0_g1_i1.p1  ORF type:complete len:115 (+),score=16.80 TRINITY_DN5637_c0_g1_i1:86-430(+)